MHRPLLCELHAHTRWSDGDLSLREVVDLYGSNGFDVLCITDHVLPADDPWLLEYRRANRSIAIDEASFPVYLHALELEAARARREYGLVVIPGLELTCNAERPELSAHAVAIGLREFVGVDDGLVEALKRARSAGAALIAAHPHGTIPDDQPLRTTQRYYWEREALAPLVDRFELFNREHVFGWVAEAGLPSVAAGDFHDPTHLATWKTLLPCEKHEAAIVSYLRSGRPAYLVPPRVVSEVAAPAAA